MMGQRLQGLPPRVSSLREPDAEKVDYSGQGKTQLLKQTPDGVRGPSTAGSRSEFTSSKPQKAASMTTLTNDFYRSSNGDRCQLSDREFFPLLPFSLELGDPFCRTPTA